MSFGLSHLSRLSIRIRSVRPRTLRICFTSATMSAADCVSTVTEISMLALSSLPVRNFGNSLIPIRFQTSGGTVPESRMVISLAVGSARDLL